MLALGLTLGLTLGVELGLTKQEIRVILAHWLPHGGGLGFSVL